MKLFTLLRRDLISARRDALMIYIFAIPLLLALAIQLFAPGLNDTTFTFAMLQTDQADHIAFMERYAQVELFDTQEELERRILKRDEIAGFLPQPDDTYQIILQGNESVATEQMTKTFSALYQLGATKAETTAEVLDFGLTVPPLKTKLVNMLILLTIMLSGMLIALGIVEEKQDNTVHAIQVTPVSQNTFILGKSLIGGLMTLGGIVGALLITGYYGVNWAMILLVGLTSMLLSLLVGFLQGLNSNDIIEAAAGVKMLMLPIAGSIAGYEFLSDKWQWTMYWSPFYWAYKANNEILSESASWGSVLLAVALVCGLSALVYGISIPKIRKGLM